MKERWKRLVLLLVLCGCNPWQAFLSANPRSCEQNPGICQVGEVCNPQTRLCEKSEMLSLVAGGLGGFGSLDNTGAAARFGAPSGVAVDGAGNLYIADRYNSTIRKVVTSTGAVTTLVGTADMRGNADGTGAAARFYEPFGVAVDSIGNLYVADSRNHTISKVVTSTGVVTTLAGTAGMGGSAADGTGAAARFNQPTGVAVDGAGNLYVADSVNHTIRQVVTSTGVVTTLAGTAGMSGSADGTGAAARFNQPTGVAIDGAGNLYVADSVNHTIRKVVTSTGVVTTLAGTAGMSGSTDGTGAAARLHGPTGVAVDGAGNLYVADSDNNTIRKVVASTGAVTALAGTAGMEGSTDGTGAAARFNWPYSVAVDGAGNLYVADSDNNTIRKVVASTGAVTTLAGTAGMEGSTDGTGAAARLYGPIGVTIDGAGNLYVAEAFNSTIRKVVTSTGVVTTLAGTAGMRGSADGTGAAARFNSPYGVAIDGAGTLYVADSVNHTIRKVVTSTGVVTTLAGTAGMSGSADGTGAAARFNKPVGVAVDGAGNLYVADAYNSAIRKVVTSTGAVTTVAGTGARFNQPYGVAIDGAGNLYVADAGNSTIRKVVTSTGVVTTLAGTAGITGSTDGTGAAARLFAPTGVAVDGAGNVYVAQPFHSTIRMIGADTAAVTTIIGAVGQRGVQLGRLPGRLNQPSGVAISAAGEIFIVDDAENAILVAH